MTYAVDDGSVLKRRHVYHAENRELTLAVVPSHSIGRSADMVANGEGRA